MSEDAPSLFGIDGQEDPWFLLTNRFNLLEFLSSDLISPVEGLPKYYTDLLQLAPGRIPLLRAPFHESLIDAVMEEDETAFPVALELGASVLGESDAGAKEPADRLRAPTGVVPMSCVSAIHFRSQGELDEHCAREYENIRSDTPRLVVTPELFVGGDIPMSAAAEFLGELPRSELSAEQLEEEDRVNGALCGLVTSATASVGGLKAVGSVLVGKKPQIGELPRWLTAPMIEGGPRDAGADGQLFEIAFTTFIGQDRSSAWRPLDVLATIEHELVNRGLSKKHTAEIGKNLTPIRAILRNERDFKVFDPASGLSSAKALLLVLLRPDLERLLAWDQSDTGATPLERSAAAVLAGALRGRKRMPLSVRSPGLDRLLAGRTAIRLAARTIEHLNVPTPAPIDVTELVTDTGEFQLTLRCGGDILVERHRPAPTVAECLAIADLNGVDRDIAVNLCRRMGWSECITAHLVGSALDVSVDSDGGGIRMQIRGASDVRIDVEEAAFRERLAHIDLPSDVAADLLSRLGGRTDSA